MLYSAMALFERRGRLYAALPHENISSTETRILIRVAMFVGLFSPFVCLKEIWSLHLSHPYVCTSVLVGGAEGIRQKLHLSCYCNIGQPIDLSMPIRFL